jgi:hypothetical protein
MATRTQELKNVNRQKEHESARHYPAQVGFCLKNAELGCAPKTVPRFKR